MDADQPGYVPPGVPDDALSPCDLDAPHAPHDYVWGGPDPEHYWCVGVEAPQVHLLDAYTWAGRRGACGITSEWLPSAHNRAEVTCPRCLTGGSGTELASATAQNAYSRMSSNRRLDDE